MPGILKKLSNQINKKKSAEKNVSLTVIPKGPGSQDIHVEVTRNLTAKKRRSHRRFAAFLFTVMFLSLFPMVRNLFVYMNMNEEYKQLQQVNQELTAVRRRLEEERDSLDSPEMIERLAREELDMVMPGESKVYQAIPTVDIPERDKVRSDEAFH